MQNNNWTITDRKINIGLVGCGRISKNHFNAIAEHRDRVNLAGVCDINETALQKASQEYGGEGYHCLDAMLAQSDIDLYVLCTPSGLHPSQTMQIAKAGKHVLTEKPMATRWQDGLNMVKTCDEAGVRLFVVKQNRLNATLQRVKEAIDQGRFGKIYMMASNVFWTRPQDYYDQDSWRGTWEFDGGAFMNQASHYVDLMHWLGGPIESVQAMMGTLDRNIEAEDSGALNIRYRNGAIGTVGVTMLTYPKNLEGSITILGEKGTVRVGGMAVNEIKNWEFDQMTEADQMIKNASYETHSVYGHGHPIYYDNVISCLQGNAEPLVDGREGLKSLELLSAAYLAARDSRTVHLPLVL